MSMEVVRIKGLGDYLDYVYGGEDNVKNLSDEEVKCVLNLTTALILMSDQSRLLHQAAVGCMVATGYKVAAQGQDESAKYILESSRELSSLCAGLSDSKVFNYHQAAVQAIVMREERMPHGIFVQWVRSDEEEVGKGGEIGCYVEPCASKEAKE